MRWPPTSTSSAISSSHRPRNAGRREQRPVRLAVAFLATADRALAPGVRQPDGCSRRAWRRCSGCASAQCSETGRARERCPDRPGRFRAAEAHPARAHSGLDHRCPLVERKPRRGPATGCGACQPVRQERRLTEPGWSGYQHQLRLRPTAKTLAQPWTRHQIASPPRDLQLGLEQWACHDHLPSGSSLTVARDDRSRLTPPYGAR